MKEENIKKFDFFISKIMYNLIALFGLLLLFMTGMYYGYTFNQNEQYFNTSVKEIQFIKYIHTTYTYNFIPDTKLKYGDELAPRIIKSVILLTFISALLIEIGYRNNSKYKYEKSLKERLKIMYKNIKESKTW